MSHPTTAYSGAPGVDPGPDAMPSTTDAFEEHGTDKELALGKTSLVEGMFVGEVRPPSAA